jgi:aminoglycoside adenylyltransferase-like protein
MSGLDAYLRELAHRASAVLGESLVALYLHGSAAMGSFVPSRSDVDVLCITRGSLSPSQKRGLAEALSEASLPCPGVGLEMSVLTVAEARTPSDPPTFELHIATEENRVVDGAGQAGNPDLVAELAMARERGVALAGPPPRDVIAPVDRAALLQAMADDLRWAIETDRASYAVLNACRSLRFVREGTLCSKTEGGEWAIQAGLGDPDLIGAALDRQRGADQLVDSASAAAFAERVREELVRAAAKAAS